MINECFNSVRYYFAFMTMTFLYGLALCCVTYGHSNGQINISIRFRKMNNYLCNISWFCCFCAFPLPPPTPPPMLRIVVIFIWLMLAWCVCVCVIVWPTGLCSSKWCGNEAFIHIKWGNKITKRTQCMRETTTMTTLAGFFLSFCKCNVPIVIGW